MSDTPRTDAATSRIAGPNPWDPQDTLAVHVSFARRLERDIETLRRYFIAGRDMNDSVMRFLERLDAKAPTHVTDSWIGQMRIDHNKWVAAEGAARKEAP